MTHTTPVALVALAMASVAVMAQTDQDRSPPVSSRSGVERYTAIVQGVVTAADSGTPVQGAEVRLEGSGRHRLTMTDAAGRFVFADLPPERVTLHVSKAGFADAEYGQRHPLEEAEYIVLGEGQRVTADVALTRGGVIYGSVFDEFGEPAAGALVRALLARPRQGRSGLQAVGRGDQTDDTGAFRLYGLPPGTFVVSAQPGPAGTVKRGTPTYHPGTASPASALPVEIGPGAQVPVAITLGTASLARISGTVVSAAGVPSPAAISLVSDDLVTGRGLEGQVLVAPGAFQISGDAGPDGRFTLTDVPPGAYVLNALQSVTPPQLASPPAGATEAQKQAIRDRQIAQINRSFQTRETGSLPVVVTGQDVDGLTVVTRPRPMLAGRFIAGSGVRQPLPGRLVVTTMSTQTATSSTISMTDAETFQIGAPTGPFTISVGSFPGITALEAGWAISAIRLNGRDVTDRTVEVLGDGTLEIVLTDRVTTVSGTVRAGRDTDAANTSVVVFPRDDGRWTYPSRAIRTTRTGADGRFEITGLPPGQRYLAAAVDYLLPEEEFDRAFLERVRREATDFTLDRESDQRTLRLDLVTR